MYMFGLLSYFRWRDNDRLRPYAHMTVRQALDQHFRNPKLKLLLAADCGHWGSKPSRTSFVFDAMLRLSYFLGNYYPSGGSQAFADDLARRFEEQGGHILMRARVGRIIIERRTAVGVEIDVGTSGSCRRVHVLAGRIVSNADLVFTLEQMIGAEHVGSTYIESVKKLVPT